MTGGAPPSSASIGGAVEARSLRVVVAAGGADIVDGISFAIAPGEVLALVGESGSGKTTAGLAVLGHARRGARLDGGQVLIGDVDLLALPPNKRRALRGRTVTYVPQDPGAALNPARRIGASLLEPLRVHGWGAGEAERHARVVELMGEVALPADDAFLRRYPHELSGGQQQRVVLAMAFACRPSVVVLDEPTTGLDVTTQAHVLDTVRRITRLEGAAALYVSHDLAVVGALADRVAVMYAGRIVEHGTAAQVLADPAHPYTRMLVAAVPRLDEARPLTAIPGRAPGPGARPPGCPFAPRCVLREPACDERLPDLLPAARDGHVAAGHVVEGPVVEGQVVEGQGVEGPGVEGPVAHAHAAHAHAARCIRLAVARATPPAVGAPRSPVGPDRPAAVLEVRGLSAGYGGKPVVHGVGLAIGPGDCLALVGESGSGKTTVARAIAGLHASWSGQVLLDGAPLDRSARGRPRSAKRDVQYVFQNPYGSLNPRRTVGQSVARPLALIDVGRREAPARVADMLERVALPPAYATRYPDELSGGERQRVAIARALICGPRVLLCDEVTSALDVSVQASIVGLLRSLQEELELAVLFVTHNLPLVRAIAQHVVVLHAGRVVEAGPTDQVLDEPVAGYTRRLLADAPRLEAAGGSA